MTNEHPGENGAPKPFNPPPRFVPPRDTDERGRLLPMTDEQRQARFKLWEETVRKLEETIDETDDDDEYWDEFSRYFGMDPKTGRGLES